MTEAVVCSTNNCLQGNASFYKKQLVVDTIDCAKQNCFGMAEKRKTPLNKGVVDLQGFVGKVAQGDVRVFLSPVFKVINGESTAKNVHWAQEKPCMNLREAA